MNMNNTNNYSPINAFDCGEAVPNSQILEEKLRFQNLEYERQILNAAKSFFSKKTRTLYHWLHPNLPKSELKNVISAAWDNMGLEEKQFYISQAMGNTGNTQTNLMVNPQLNNIVVPSEFESNSETKAAVSNLVLETNNWVQLTPMNLETSRKRRARRLAKRPKLPIIYQNERPSRLKTKVKSIEDFPDDPELKVEFEKFQNAFMQQK